MKQWSVPLNVLFKEKIRVSRMESTAKRESPLLGAKVAVLSPSNEYES
jgi:hypothetical protein